MEGFKVIIAADASQGINAVHKFNAELNKTGLAAPSVSTAVTKVNASLNSIKPASNTAGQALMNLGRIAQDAPFGFIGIANNINPLLESFQRLKTESGSTKAALSSLVAGLSGGAGLGLAVSIASSLLISFGSALFSSGKAAASAKKEVDAYAESVAEATRNVSEEASKIQVLISFIKDENTSRGDRIKAIEQLQQIAPSYFSHLNTEKATVEQVSGAYAAFTQNLIKSVEARVRQEQLTKIIEQRVKEEAFQNTFEQTAIIGGKVIKVQNFLLQTTQERKKAQLNINLLREQELAIAEEINKLKSPDLGGGKIPPVKTQSQKQLEILVDDVVIRPLRPLTIAGARGKALAEQFATLELKASVTIDPKLLNKGITEIEARFKTFRQNIDATITGIANNAAVAIGESLGNAFAGTTDIFGGFIGVLADGLKEIGKAAIAYGIGMLAIKNALKNPTTAIIAGIAMVAVGAALKSVLAARKFAEGGIVTGPTNAIIGEAGPEVVFPLNKLNRFLNGMSGQGRREIFIAENRIDGNDIVTIYRRASNRYGGTFS